MLPYMTIRKLLIIIIGILLIQLIFCGVYLNYLSFESAHQKFNSIQNRKSATELIDNADCTIEGKQIRSALRRIQSDTCRKECLDAYCLIQNHRPWKSNVPNRCKNLGNDNFVLNF